MTLALQPLASFGLDDRRDTVRKRYGSGLCVHRSATPRSVGTLAGVAGFGGRRPTWRPILAIVSRRWPVSRSTLPPASNLGAAVR